MEHKEFVCIGCPVGCLLSVEVAQDEIRVTGNECKRGEVYGKKEAVHPERIVTTSIVTNIDGETRVVSVKTDTDIPKELIFDCLQEVKKLKIDSPVHTGDILIPNVLGTKANIVATATNEIKR